jgi:hypothetical protein
MSFAESPPEAGTSPEPPATATTTTTTATTGRANARNRAYSGSWAGPAGATPLQPCACQESGPGRHGPGLHAGLGVGARPAPLCNGRPHPGVGPLGSAARERPGWPPCDCGQCPKPQKRERLLEFKLASWDADVTLASKEVAWSCGNGSLPAETAATSYLLRSP